MVNVPGRSKGCNTCRRRKKGCDLQKPVCARCIRDGQRCEGYERSTIFVSHQPERASGKPTRVPAVRAKAQQSRRTSPATVVQMIPVRQDLMNVAFQQQAFAKFCDTYLPKGEMDSRGAKQSLTTQVWIDKILELATSHVPLRQALCALSIASIGGQEGDDYKLRQGAENYGAAVVRINQLLQSDAVYTDDGIIPTCQLLSYYEQFNGFAPANAHAQGRNWQAHAAGMARIMQFRQPYRLKTEVDYIVLRQARVSQLAYWCGTRKACPFATEDWKNLPYTGIKPNIRDRLFDVLVDVPGLLERSDQANLPGFEALKMPLIQDCLATHQSMQNWLQDAQFTLRCEDSEEGNSPFFMDETDYLMMHGMDIAASAMQFWAVSILLCGTLRVLSLGVAPEHSVNTDAEDTLNPRLYASKIVRCMHHFLNTDAGLIGFQNASFPLGIAMMFYAAFQEVETAERETIRRHLFGPSAVKPYGAMMGAFLQQLQDESARRWKVKQEAKAMDNYSSDRLRSKVWFHGKEHQRESSASPGLEVH